MNNYEENVMKPKIYDCFTYFNEEQLLKLRLETLWDSVDYFVICESMLTFTGKPKSINFNSENFKKYLHKIRYLLIKDSDFYSEDPWVYEAYQRNYLMHGLHDAKDHDWIIVSDVDEIPNPEALTQFNPNKYIKANLLQTAYVYYLNNQVMRGDSPFIWSPPTMTTYENLKHIFKCPERLRNYKGGTDIFRGIRKTWAKWRAQKISNGGWHFTWMGGVERVLLKMQSYSHQEFNTPENRLPHVIEQRIRTGGDVLGVNKADGKLNLIHIDHRLPKYLQQNPQEFNNLILTPEAATK